MTVFPEGGAPFVFDGVVLREQTPAPNIFGRHATLSPDLSFHQPVDLFAIDPSGPRLVEHFDVHMLGMGVSAHHIRGSLYVLTWATGGENQFRRASDADALSAEYVCILPP